MVSLLTVTVVALVTGHVLLRITAQMETAHRSTAWNEALSTAESAVDMTVADLSALLPDVRANSEEGLAIGVSQLSPETITALGVTSSGLRLAQGETVSFSPAPLVHGGEGSGRQEATVFLDVLSLRQLLSTGLLNAEDPGGLLSNPLDALNGGDLQLVRLRARGTVPIASRRSDRTAADAQLRRATLVWDRTTGQRATRATMSREIEVILKPVHPYQSAVTTAGSLRTQSANVVIDSFNSLLSTASTGGRYDVSKRLRNGDVNADDANVVLAGMIYGDVRTSGADIVKTDRITGEVNNTYAQPLPLIRTPTWTRTPLSPTEVTGPTTLAAGTVIAPRRYKFDRITGSLRITGAVLGLATEVEIWVTGDITGSLTFDPGVRAKVYVQGDMLLDTNRLVNGSQRAANLQIFGLSGSVDRSTPTIRLGLGDVCAAIYAPTHDVRLTGDGHFQGAITAASFQTSGNAHIHYDEGLALDVGPILGYEIASWTERML